MEGQITLKISEILYIIGGISGPLAIALVVVWKRSESKNKVIIDLTKSFVEATKDHTKALENNTEAMKNNVKVIEDLPESIMLHIKASIKL